MYPGQFIEATTTESRTLMSKTGLRRETRSLLRQDKPERAKQVMRTVRSGRPPVSFGVPHQYSSVGEAGLPPRSGIAWKQSNRPPPELAMSFFIFIKVQVIR